MRNAIEPMHVRSGKSATVPGKLTQWVGNVARLGSAVAGRLGRSVSANPRLTDDLLCLREHPGLSAATNPRGGQ